ncbi:MAG: DUF459 domain-containing protein [Oricola sp.]
MSQIFRMMRGLAVLIVAAVLVQGAADVAGAPGIGTAAAHAQERRTLLDLLFRGGRREPEPQARTAPRTEKRRRPTAPRSSAAPAPAPKVEQVEKAENAQVILVVGDFTASGLAQGLEEAFAEVPTIRIESRANGSSGFVRDDFYDWPASIGPIIEEVKPALVVMMIGSNDRQSMRVDGTTQNVRSEAWDKEYVARINRFAKAVRGSGVPLIWVGGPPFRFKSMSTDILAFNEFYRNAAEAVGGSFVDIWDGFVDQDGAFVLSGSDINGQTVRLRNSDGISFTKAGKRKLAFYVEREIRQMFGAAAAPLQVGLEPEAFSTMRLPPLRSEADLERIDPIPLADPELDGGVALLGDVNVPEAASAGSNPLQAKSVRKRLVEDGIPPPAKPGRANDFEWPATGG